MSNVACSRYEKGNLVCPDSSHITGPTDSPPITYQTLLRSLPIDQYALSQTDYGPLCYFPAPIAIETKTNSGDLEEAKIQLGVWVAAWFQRMRLLFPQDYQTMPVPLLVARAESWMAYYACEREKLYVDFSLFYFELCVALADQARAEYLRPRYDR